MSQITSRWFISHFFLFEGKYDKAINILEESISLSQKYSESNLLYWSQMELALVYLNNGRTQKFETLIKKVTNNSIGILRVQALGWLAINYVKRGKINEAQELLNELQNENRLIPVGIMQLPLQKEMEKAKIAFGYQINAEIYLAKMDYDKARDYFNKVIELTPSSQLPALTALSPRIRWVALRSLAHVYEEMGNLDSAIATYQTIIDEKVLTITVPAASSLWVNSLLAMSNDLEKQGDSSQSKIYREKYERLRVKNY
jgi:tetratricopeptide (TPR) repeat protein